MITINLKAKMTEKAQFTDVNKHFEVIFNVEIGRKGGFAKASVKHLYILSVNLIVTNEFIKTYNNDKILIR